MELHHLHVLEPNARPIRERHTIAGTDVAVGGERVDASEATRGEDHRLCRDRLESTTPHVDRNHAQAPRILDQELGGEDVVMPPKGRAEILPSGSRLHGQPQCSIWITSIGASRTNASTTSWSAR